MFDLLQQNDVTCDQYITIAYSTSCPHEILDHGQCSQAQNRNCSRRVASARGGYTCDTCASCCCCCCCWLRCSIAILTALSLAAATASSCPPRGPSSPPFPPEAAPQHEAVCLCQQPCSASSCARGKQQDPCSCFCLTPCSRSQYTKNHKGRIEPHCETLPHRQ